jgi:hypothetical protein
MVDVVSNVTSILEALVAVVAVPVKLAVIVLPTTDTLLST